MKMHAITVRKSGGPEVLTLEEVDRPVPGPKDVLVRVMAATVTAGDVKLRSISRAILVPVGIVFGFKPMSIAGVEFAGVIEATGSGVTDMKPGDKVMGTTTGLSRGANAPWVVVPRTSRMGVLVPMPDGLPFEQAAALPVGAMTAWQILQRAGDLKGRRILVYGASGSVGSMAVQLALVHGATVTAMASAANGDMVNALGPLTFLDYRTRSLEQAGPQDIVFDAVGVLKNPDLRKVFGKGVKVLSVRGPTSENVDELAWLAGLAASGAIKPWIDRVIGLAQVPEAHRLVESGRKRGNIVVSVG